MPWTNASIVLNGRDRANATAGNYNNANFNANGQNIIQGQIHSVAVSEVNFPYDIPNIQMGPAWSAVPWDPAQHDGAPSPYGIYNTFILENGIGDVLNIKVVPGFYIGTELETAVNDAITAAGAANSPALTPDEMPTLVYDDTQNLFRFDAPTTNVGGGAASVWYISSPYTCPTTNAAVIQATLGKDIFSIMGFQTSQNGDNFVDGDPVQGYPSFNAAGSAPLTFTQYIDICSPQLCKGQRFRDGSTTNLARRSDVICRLYISNNVAIQESEGARPFVINRQFNNARVMKWTTDNSVGTIDIQLYDDVGQPLTTTWQPRPYQITFNCYEQNTDGDDRMLSDHLKSLIGGAASYL